MLFAALPGTKADGMAYASEACRRGAAAILTGNNPGAVPLAVPVLQSPRPRQALALLSARFYGSQPKTIAAVTGTNGKTSVVSFLRQIWAHGGFEAASLGTIGIVTAKSTKHLAHTTPDPVLLHKELALLAQAGVTHLALEASSHGLDQNRLDGVRISAGALTNITRDHLDYHPTLEHYLNAKLRLFRELLEAGAPAAFDADSPGAEAAIEAARAARLEVLTAGLKGSTIALRSVERSGFKQRLSLTCAGRQYRLELPLAGAFQVSNALVAACLALGLGSEPGAIFEAVGRLRGASGRLELIGHTREDAPVFVDYAHTPDALIKAMEALSPYASGRLHVLFGCGGDRDKGKRPEMGRAAAAYADRVYVTDDNPRSEDPAAIRKEILAAAPGAAEIANRGESIRAAVGSLKRGDVLLVAGKGHETGQIVGQTRIPFSDQEAVATALAAIGSEVND
jgi:UDP-N-acetylmuramoyl-L-alanyl-D-glutamate--2,6-diaminopimelate ligase